jgi:DNA polymerase-1
MVVTNFKFPKVMRYLLSLPEPKIGLDTETYGLRFKDTPFSLILSADQEYYFNFHMYKGLAGDYILPISYLEDMKPLFENSMATWFIHNAKFDINMLRKLGINITGKIHCTYTGERICKNDFLPGQYSLASCSERHFEVKKLDIVEKLISSRKLYTVEKVPGKKKIFRNKHFDQVPFNIIVEYGERDAHLHRMLGFQQEERLKQLQLEEFAAKEMALTPICADIEYNGVKIDMDYVEAAIAHEEENIFKAEKHFEKVADGWKFKDSNKWLAEVFEDLKLKYPVTEKGNPSFNSDALERLDHPIAEAILRIRHHEKYLGTYYSSFKYFADDRDMLHANMNQAGTATGRFSYSEPNLQNVPKEDDEEYKNAKFSVRRCFIPESEDYCLVAIDYDQQEFRMMLDYAGEKDVIERINKGEDVHQATADVMGVSRKEAKTINFGLLYGMGPGKLADALKIDYDAAKKLRNQYFRSFPGVKRFIQDTVKKGENLGFIHNWAGRLLNVDYDFAYKLPNYLIQGGCADVIKHAMLELHPFLTTTKSRILLQVHDELLFQVHKDDLHIVKQLKEIMESIYQPQNGMELTVSVEHSWKSWSHWDKVKGAPSGKRNNGSGDRGRRKADNEKTNRSTSTAHSNRKVQPSTGHVGKGQGDKHSSLRPKRLGRKKPGAPNQLRFGPGDDEGTKV